MKRNWTRSLALVVAVAAACVVTLAAVEVRTEKENVVASRLVGRWKTHVALTERLRDEAGQAETIVFVRDDTVGAQIPERYGPFLDGKHVYLAGSMARRQKTYPFILTEMHGNPHLFYFRERDGVPMGDSESFNLFIARAKDPSRDLLFIGGDFNNQPFSAYERAE